MNWEAIGAIGEIFGAAAVVVSLLYLALQMRQNTRQLRRAELNAAMDQQSAHRRALMTSPDLGMLFARGLADPSSLNEGDATRVGATIDNLIWCLFHIWDRARSGDTPADMWSLGVQRLIAGYLGSPFGRNWWSEMKETYPAAYCVEVDRIVSTVAPFDGFRSLLGTAPPTLDK